MATLPDLTLSEAAPVLRRMMRRHVVVVMPDNRVLEWPFRPGDANDARTFCLWHKGCDATHPGALLLNEMPFDDALTAFAAAMRREVTASH
jgi:hypothetical protein